MVLEALRSEAGIENIAAAERAMLAVAYGTDEETVMARAALAAKHRSHWAGLLNCSPFNAETQVVAMETNYRIIALSLGPTGSIADYPLLEEDYLAHGAHCTGNAFAGFVWRYQQVIQHDLLLLGYVVLVEKGTETFEERNSGVFWVTLSSDVHPPSPKRRHRLRRSSLSSNGHADELQHADSQ